jgi:hypothetical protein
VLSPVFLSSRMCYRTIYRGRRLMLPPMNNTRKQSVVNHRIVLSRVGWYAWQKWRVLVRMIEFIGTLVTTFFNYTHITGSRALPRIYTHFIIHCCTHTSPLLVMQLKHRNQCFRSLRVLHINTVFKSHFKSSQVFYEIHGAVSHRELSVT